MAAEETENTRKYLLVLREKVLSDCRSDQAFWTCRGHIIRNLPELANAIEAMNEWAFVYHVNDENQKNDFAQWIKDVLQDGSLAHQLKKTRDKKQYLKIIKSRIEELESVD